MNLDPDPLHVEGPEPDYDRQNRSRSGLIAALCFLALVVLVLGGTRHG